MFNQQLWDKADVVIKHSNDRRKQLEQFITILSKRIDIQEYYAKSLEQNGKMAEKVKQGQQNIPEYAFTSFKQDCANRSAQTRTFAKSLRQQILFPLRSLVANQQQESKQHQKDWKRMDKQIQQLQHNIIKCRNRYDDQYNDYQQMLMINQISLESHKMSKDKRSKVISKTNQLMKGLNELERNYERAISDYNSFLAQFYLELVKILDTFQKQEEARLAIQQQNIMKMLVFETSMMKNFEYDLNTIAKQVEKIKKVDSIKEFVEKHKTGREREKGQSRHLRKNMLGESIYRIISKDMQKRIGLQNNAEFKKYIESKYKKEKQQTEFTLFKPERLAQFQKLFEIIDLCWKGESLNQAQKQQLSALLKDQVNRLSLWMYLHKFQSTNNKVVIPEGYKAIVELVSILLDICNQHQDVFVARKITNLSFCIYQQSKQGQKKHLHMALNDCKIYALTDYWKAAIFETAQEELILHCQESNNEQSELKFMSLVLGQLAMFCHQMILLGVPSKEVRQSVGWFCRLYDIPDDQNRDLARTVNASMKIYKQMFKPAEVPVPVVEVVEQPVRKISFQIAGEKVEEKVEEKPQAIENQIEEKKEESILEKQQKAIIFQKEEQKNDKQQQEIELNEKQPQNPSLNVQQQLTQNNQTTTNKQQISIIETNKLELSNDK